MTQNRGYEHRIGANRLRGAVAWFCVCTFALDAAAQQSRKPAAPQAGESEVHLLGAAEGREIAAAALAINDPKRSAQDCSHLVQQVYSDAGYAYAYASSFDLYAGNANFRRVRHAQPGDLVAWPGHVGIVIDPARHSFHSLVRSGLQTEDYTGPYWRSRGRPRFYRYMIGAAPEVRTAKVTRAPRPASGSATDGDIKSVEEEPNAQQEMSEAALRSKIIATPAAVASDATKLIPSSIAITAERRAPTAEEALDGISELSNAAAGALRSAQPLNVRITVVVLDELQVERIETKRDKGWAHLQIGSHVRISADGTDFKRRREKVRWELRRDVSGWVAVAPAERTYVARDAAVRALAADLAEMTQSEGAAQHQENVVTQEARIANLLSALLQDQ